MTPTASRTGRDRDGARKRDASLARADEHAEWRRGTDLHTDVIEHTAPGRQVRDDPLVGTPVRHQRPVGSSTRTSTRDAWPSTVMRNGTMSPTVASGGALIEIRTLASVTIGHTIPIDEQREREDSDRDDRVPRPVTLPAATP